MTMETGGDSVPNGEPKAEAGGTERSSAEVSEQVIEQKRAGFVTSWQTLNSFKEEKDIERLSFRQWREGINEPDFSTMSEEEKEKVIGECVESDQRLWASNLFDARVSPDDELLSKAEDLFTPEDYSSIKGFLFEQLQGHIQLGTLPRTPVDGERQEFAEDREWLNSWKEYFEAHPELGMETEKVGEVPVEETPPEEAAPEEVAPGEAQIPPEKRRLARKIWKALRVGVKNWAQNLKPTNIFTKDWRWKVGFGVGVAESVVFTALPIPGLNGLIKTGLNAAFFSGGHLALNVARGYHEETARRTLAGDETALKVRMEQIAQTFGGGHERLKQFALGVSAGVTYTTVTGLGLEIAKEVAAGMQVSLPSQPPDIGKVLEDLGSQFPRPPQVLPPEISIPETEVVPEIGALSVSPQVQETLQKIVGSQDWTVQKAAEVGKMLPVSDEIIQKTLEQKGMSLAGLDAAAVEKAKLAIQHALERQANTSFDSDIAVILKENPNIDPASLMKAGAKAGQKSFESWLETPDAQSHLSEIAGKALTEQLQIEDALAQKVTEALTADPSLFTEHSIVSGTTVGEMLQEQGYSLTWDGQNAELFGAHIAANFNLLSDMWEKMAEAHPNLVSGPFPVSLSEINDLVAKAQMGDEEALRRLKEALHWIPSGARFKILTQTGNSQILAMLKELLKPKIMEI